ncbi:DUF1249 domain-containing protein [Dasania sp. GY-MA-18]|uniref:DUF1249 domain-containing protein n=1 Tax=Dasania phycosphaerae TaxID=2950436 RepID=A0A9J6RKF8_9GAMM|nr:MULTISPECIES: DUF1249 domain-containing protein [Dasania]MCR8922454.1 DUF1249 domain-containing protein [Dasania sp. GY-MA-18]MCZ0864882.1 DUF1249 domain-containing protein [Dasania phycosphaerae]MCZ0868610.1 DUF1249 domain-containing protein [Dasania phycosphaerae]
MLKKQTTDLAGQMAECEANYARVMKLMPEMADENQRQFWVQLPGEQSVRFRLKVLERCAYTTIMEFSQIGSNFTGQLDWAPAPHFTLRVYHDARMAEVSAFHGNHRLRSHYNYPNKAMYQRDEKAQLNQLLGQWLRHCLDFGHVDQPVGCV